MKILLLYTNRNQQSLCPSPVSFAYLSHELKREGHTVKILDLMFSKNPLRDLARTFENYNPDLTGISIRNLDNQNMLSPDNPIPEVKDYIAHIRKNFPGVKIVTGGTAFTTFPEEMFRYLNPDYGLCGQGESTLARLVRSIEKGVPDLNIPGLVRAENGAVRMNPYTISGYENTHADWSIMNLRKYRRSLWPASVVIKTGCIYDCSYCDGGKVSFGTGFVFRQPGAVIDDIKSIIRKCGIRCFFFIDPCFGSPLDKTKEILEDIIKSGLKILFMTPFSPIKGSYDDELFRLYRMAGGIFSMMGCDTLSEKMLLSYRKPFSLGDILDWSETACRNKVKFAIELLIGGPGENEETVRESMASLEKIQYSLFLYGIGIRILPETGIYETAKRERFFINDGELLFPKFYVSRELDVEWAKKFIEDESSKYKKRMSGLLPVMVRNFAARYLNLVF